MGRRSHLLSYRFC